MIGYATLGTANLEKAAAFYDALAAELGLGRTMEWPGFIAWGGPGRAGLALVTPHDGKPASVGNGTMIALATGSPEQVDRMHALALAHGGSCEGPPGPRNDWFYAAYFRDPDGNKLNAFHTTHMPG